MIFKSKLGEQQTAVVEIRLNHPVCMEKFSEIKSLGRFTLREAGRTVAAGIINEIFV
jgi:translation elongation factor EF-1alpha